MDECRPWGNPGPAFSAFTYVSIFAYLVGSSGILKANKNGFHLPILLSEGVALFSGTQS